MTRVCLLFGFWALSHGQIIYPDQYEMMKTSTVSPYISNNNVRASRLPTAGYFAPQANSDSKLDEVFREDAASQLGAQQTVQTHPLHSSSAPTAFYQPSPLPTSPPSPQPLPQDWANHVNDIISKGIMKFALDLDKAILSTRGTSSAINDRNNLIFSPLSISVALSLILLGSGGTTFDEVSRVLGLEAGVDISRHSEVVHQMFGLLLAIVNYRVEEGNGPRVDYASGIFVQEGYPIRPEFRAISENVYKSEVINLDFQRKGREAQSIINDWVKQRTMGKITSILRDVPSPVTNVILLSALYFNGEWNQHFIEGATRRKQFFVEPDEAIYVDMMYNGGPFPFYEDKSLGVKILALPYKGLEMSMYVLLPKAEGAAALRTFHDQLTVEIIENLISNLKNQTCIIGLPRMKLSSTLSLKRALQSLGLQSLFDLKTADLSLLSYGQHLPTLYATQQAIPITSPSPLPQALSQALPQTLSQALPQTLPQALPQTLPQTSPQGSVKFADDDHLIFSRVGGNNNEGLANGIRRNFFRYDDKIHGVSVEQWNTGFYIRKIRRTVRANGRYNDTLRVAYRATENDDLRGNSYVVPKIDDDNTRYISLENNKYRFNKAKQSNRRKRQSRPIDEGFLRFIQGQNFPSYGLDDLRNSANLVNPGLFAEEVLHKVEMDVTERGTEAAAATGVILERDGNQKRLVANRPFIFFIRHDSSKLILFWGIVNTPTPNYAAVR